VQLTTRGGVEVKIKLFCFLFLLLCVYQTTLFAQQKYGTLKVFTETKGSDIYVDGKLAGEDSVVIEEIDVGTHYIRVETSGDIYYSKLIEIRPNEVTSVLVEAKSGLPKMEEKKITENAETIEAGKIRGVSSYINFYGSFAFLSLSENALGTTYNFNLDPIFGIGIDFNSGTRDSTIGFNFGVNYNFGSKYTFSGLAGSGNLNLHNAYANIIFNVQKSENSEINVGTGLNLSNWSIPNVTGSMGYQGYFELLFPSQPNLYSIKIGYEIFNATETGGSADSKGLFIRGGYAYKI